MKKNGLNMACESGTLPETTEDLMTEHPLPDQTAQDEVKPLSPVLENYLEIIFLEEAREGAARASAIAEAAKVSRSTVTSTLKVLKFMGLVEYEPYSLIHLTEKGRIIGRDIAHRHIIFREFFLHVLQLDEERADAVACELEHVVPPDVIRRWGQFVLYLRGRDFWKNWQDDYSGERGRLLQTMTESLNQSGLSDNQEDVQELARKYR